jgi:flagellar FliL protein
MAEEEKEEKKSSKLLPIIIGAVGGIVLLLAGLALGFFLFSSPAADPSAEVDEIIEKNTEGEDIEEDDNTTPDKVALDTPENQVFLTTYYEFPGSFTTNLMNSRKFLQISVGVSTQYDDRVMANVEAHQLALRSEILGTMSEFTEESIQGKAGRQSLAASLQDAINSKLEVLENFGGIDEVHFTSFVLQ